MRAQEGAPIVLDPHGKDFIFFADTAHRLSANVPAKDDDGSKDPGALKTINVELQPFPVGTQEVPEIRVTVRGVDYLMPAHKIIVVPPKSDQPGCSVQSALDPNGTGNYQVIVIFKSPDWSDKDKKISLLRDRLPEGVEVVSNHAGWSNPRGGIFWKGSLVFHNRTGRPFILDASYFENLPKDAGFTAIEIPAAD